MTHRLSLDHCALLDQQHGEARSKAEAPRADDTVISAGHWRVLPRLHNLTEAIAVAADQGWMLDSGDSVYLTNAGRDLATQVQVICAPDC